MQKSVYVPLTVEEVKERFPEKAHTVTQEAVDIINASQSDPEFQVESLVDQAELYQQVISGTKYGIKDYIHALRFCAFICTNDCNYTEAFIRVFSDRDFVKKRKDLPKNTGRYKQITFAASRYRRTKIVVDILTITQIPLDMLFGGERYRAMGVLVNIMDDPKVSARDRSDAAWRVLQETRGADTVRMELSIGAKSTDALDALNDKLNIMAARQEKLLKSGGAKVEEFGSMVIDAEFVDEKKRAEEEQKKLLSQEKTQDMRNDLKKHGPLFRQG